MLEDWNRELRGFAEQLKMRRPPPLLVKRSRFDRMWVIASLVPKPGAWAGLGRIVISAEFLDASREIRRYLLAHELGHIFRRHSERILAPWCITVTLGAMIVNEKRLGLSSEPLLKILIAAVWFSAAGYMLWTARGFQSEYEADAIAVRLIGRPAVVEGIYTLAQHEGGLTAKRRARLKALGEQIHESA